MAERLRRHFARGPGGAAAALVVTMLAAGLLLATFPATAKPFRWASDGDAATMDPYGRNETFLLTFLGNIYEPLARRDESLRLEPALAVSWEQAAPDVWRFRLREDVAFHDGSPFTADDVLFSLKRARHPASRMQSKVARIVEARKVDDHTVDLVTDGPDPILPDEICEWFMMSRSWAERNGAVDPADLSSGQESYASRNANGTGPFLLNERQPDVRTVLIPNPRWWDKARHNLDEVTFLPLANEATRVAALISGQIDMIYAVPPQDTQRLSQTPGLRILETPELRVVFFGMDQKSEGDGAGGARHPFKDLRVRQALYQAIDIDAIRTKVMRGSAVPVGNLVARGVHGYDAEADARFPYDPAASKRLLAEAGYPNGFAFTMDCPNDRYVNDATICQAVVAMFARIGVRADLDLQTRSRHFGKLNQNKSRFYMLGWTPATYDAHNVILNVMMTPDGKGQGTVNYGGYSNPHVDELGRAIAVENDPARRDAMIREALTIHRAEFGHLPLHQQAVVWAVRDGVHVVQFGDNGFPLRLVRLD
jgi:peptide/nickel transport system substrate-binding protein